jgi:hypothetical protein
MATFGTFVAGQVLTAAELNTAGAWNDYTPSWTQSATITKTVDWARYTQLGKWVHGSIKMTASSAGTANNKILVGLPVTASANNFIIGSMMLFDNSATSKYKWDIGFTLYESSTTMSFNPRSSSGVSDLANGAEKLGQDFVSGGTSVTGFTIASGDIFWIQFMYEAA